MGKQKRILIVEDDPDTAEMLRTYFEAQGYEIMITAWGKDALELCQKSLPDLIIQDIRLPDMDGYQVVSELRRNHRTNPVPIIFLTERKSRADRISGLKLGAVDYITKPFDIQELRLRVRNALRRASYASLVSPVTGLPGKEVTHDRLRVLLELDDWAVLYVSISHLEPFSEAYGFVAGDDVLRAVGLIISNVMNELGTDNDFVGHINRTDFVLITEESKAKDVRDKLGGRLGRAISFFYPVKDLESGKLSAPMQAEVGMVVASRGAYDSPEAILEATTRSREPVAAIHVQET